ncbi:MAG: T9SS type A sorting domain-containing protein [Ignavibacteria bacterium]|nr:T9SS type A sorting domain-containing protein [Ignavibacteria bacterium]
MKNLIIIFALFMTALSASAQTKQETITVRQDNKQHPPHFFLDNDGTLSMSQDGGFTWQKVGKSILEEKDITTPATFITITPSPIKSDGKITLKLEEKGIVEVVVMNIAGSRLQTVASGVFDMGQHSWNIETGLLPSGVYICSVSIAGKTTRTLFTLQK